MFYFLFDKFQLQQQDSILNTAFYQLVILLLLLQPRKLLCPMDSPPSLTTL